MGQGNHRSSQGHPVYRSRRPEEYVASRPLFSTTIPRTHDVLEVTTGTKLWGISPSGHSYWARTAKIDATDKGGNATPFFIKVSKSRYRPIGLQCSHILVQVHHNEIG